MKVILVDEVNHGLICVAKTPHDAIEWLIENCWIDEQYEIWDGRDQCWVAIIDYLGEDWNSLVRGMSFIEFNELFQGDITLDEVNVYEGKH